MTDFHKNHYRVVKQVAQISQRDRTAVCSKPISD